MEDFYHKIRDPIHGFIHYNSNEERLINHRLFQRLRRIHQLSSAFLVYPGATHSRFEHSLGVMELATKTYDALKENCFNEFNKVIPSGDSDRFRRILRYSAFLHDLGHPPFSHAGELKHLEVKKNQKLHEFLSISQLEDGEIRKLLNEDGSDTANIVATVLGKGKKPPELDLLSQILKADIDVDRTDYLLRDAYHCGVQYGRFDHQRLLKSLALKDSTTSGSSMAFVAINRSGVHALEEMIFARHFMYSQVYYNRHVLRFDHYLAQFLKEFFKRKRITSKNVLEIYDYDDAIVLAEMNYAATALGQMAKKYSPAERKWAKLFLSRDDQFKCVLSTTDYATIEEKNFVEQLANKLSIRGAELFSVVRDDTIHKYEKSTKEITCNNCNTRVLTRNLSLLAKKKQIICSVCGNKMLIGDIKSPVESGHMDVIQDATNLPLSLMDVSPILDQAPSTFRIARLYARGKESSLATLKKEIDREMKPKPEYKLWRFWYAA